MKKTIIQKLLYVLLIARMNKKVKYKYSASLLTGVFVFALLFSANVSQAAFVPGGMAGPIVTAGIGKSLPAWFMDQNGLAIEIMEAIDGFGISGPIQGGNDFSAELGFSGEGFYWTADAIPVNPAGSVSKTILALEVAYLGGTVEGSESIFGRIRHRYDVDVPGTYTIRHPFGTKTYVVDVIDPGAPEINDSSDIGCAGVPGIAICDPILTLNSGIGPFLTWDTFNLNPALSDPLLVNAQNPTKRYIGNPNIPHAITGSPVGQNFIRIEGPATSFAGAGFIQENLFTVTGRIAVVDTIAPTIVSTAPASVPLGSNNVVLSANVTDDLRVIGVTADLGALSNTFTATLNKTQEVPATTSTATGSGTFTIDTNANTLTYNISASGLQGGSITGMHIHGSVVPPNGALGQNSAITFDLGTTLPANGTWNYPEEIEAEILAGRTYVNIHTTLFSNGEIRGQIIPTPNIVNMIRNAGSETDGTWSLILPNLDRAGLFNIPITATDGSNSTTIDHSLAVTILSGLNVTPTTASINTGLTQQLSASALDQFGNALVPQPTINWSSGDNAIATVDGSGLVTAIAPGTVTITATAIDGVITVEGTSSITVTTAAVCQTAADTNLDGIIGNVEILSYIGQWKLGNVLNSLILQAIGFWKVGVGC